MEGNDFQSTQVFKIKEGDTEKVFPLYNLDTHRDGKLEHDPTPIEIKQNVSANCLSVKDRLQQSQEIHQEEIAIVGYGPTLKETWPSLKSYQTIISTSGAHKFLLDRDIVPTYHVDIDYRERKAVHLIESHSDVVYLLCSTVHPKMVSNVGSNRLKLWHSDFEGLTYPDGELCLPGYWDVGQQAILVASSLGYQNQHLFGFDYSFEIDTDKTHAGFHNAPERVRVVAKVGDKYFPTSDDMVRGVLTFIKLMEDNPNLTLIIHSDGLLSNYLKYHFSK